MKHMNIRVLLVAGLTAGVSNIKDFLQRSMSPSFLIHQYENSQEAVRFLVDSNCGVDIILLDVGTVDRENAKKVFQQVNALVADIPVIILTGATEQDLAMLLIKDDISNGVMRETFMASPEKLKDAIEFILSKNDMFKKRPGRRSFALQETMEAEESAAQGSRYASEQPLSHPEPPPQTGIWLNGGYYVSRPKTSGTKVEYDLRNAEFIEATNIVVQPKTDQRMIFKLHGKINGSGTAPSIQLMPHRPAKGPKP